MQADFGRLSLQEVLDPVIRLGEEGSCLTPFRPIPARCWSAFIRQRRLGRSLVDDQNRRGGMLTLRDLQEFEAERKRPIKVSYRGYEVLLLPPSSTGGALTAFSLKLLG